MSSELIAFCNMAFAPFIGLLIILIDYQIRRPSDIIQKRLLTAWICFILLTMLCDFIFFIVDNMTGTAPRTINIIVSSIYFLFKAISFGCVVILFEYTFKGELVARRIKWLGSITGTIILIHIVLLVTNLYSRRLFYITPDNTYVRGDWYPIIVILGYMFMIIIFANIFLNRKNMTSSTLILALTSTVPLALGSMSDVIWAPSFITWPTTLISVLFFYLFVLRTISLLDNLTNVYNRRGLDEHLKSIARSTRRGNYAFIMSDVDQFKAINDQFGHAQGDIALLDIAEAIRSSVRKSDFIARYGGDEFIVVASGNNSKVIVDNILARLHEHNEKQIRSYTLSLSCGHDVYKHDDPRTPSEFITHVDSLMYAEKERRRN